MLTIEHKDGEKVVISHEGETLEIYVRQTEQGKIKLGFSGPRSFSVSRVKDVEVPA